MKTNRDLGGLDSFRPKRPLQLERVTIVEVAPRDGLQNERVHITTPDKITFVDILSTAGFERIETSAFVSAKCVPQMGDAEGVFRGIARKRGTRYSALVPNLRGLERARSAGVTEVSVFPAVSETFSRRNVNQSVDESLAQCRQVFACARDLEVAVRGAMPTSFGCPYEGEVQIDRVLGLALRLLDLGAFEVALCDTIGVAQPAQVERLLGVMLKEIPANNIALHFHDTRGNALANVLMALQYGITVFDASAGGMGGCPYTPGATGNLATEELVHMLDGFGITTGVDLGRVVHASRFIESRLGTAVPSRYV